MQYYHHARSRSHAYGNDCHHETFEASVKITVELNDLLHEFGYTVKKLKTYGFALKRNDETIFIAPKPVFYIAATAYLQGGQTRNRVLRQRARKNCQWRLATMKAQPDEKILNKIKMPHTQRQL